MEDGLLFYGGAVFLVAAALLLVVWRRSGAQPGSVGGAIEQVAEAAILARELVAAAEQLWLTGRLQRDERLEYVMDKLAGYFPELDRAQVYPLVEAAVYWLKLFKEQDVIDLPAVTGDLLKVKSGGRL